MTDKQKVITTLTILAFLLIGFWLAEERVTIEFKQYEQAHEIAPCAEPINN